MTYRPQSRERATYVPHDLATHAQITVTCEASGLSMTWASAGYGDYRSVLLIIGRDHPRGIDRMNNSCFAGPPWATDRRSIRHINLGRHM